MSLEPPSELTVVSLLRRALVFEKAKGLVRAKRFDDALSELEGHPDILQSPQGHEFVAKVATLRGDHVRARTYWLQILSENPQHSEAKKMVEAIDVWLARPPWLMTAVTSGVILLLVLVISVVFVSKAPRKTPPMKASVPITVAGPTSGKAVPAAAQTRPADAPSPIIRFSIPAPPSETARKD